MKRTMLFSLLAWLLLSAGVVLAGDKLLTVRVTQAFDPALEQVQDVLGKHGFTVAHIQKCDGGLHHMGYETDNYKIVFFGRLEEVRELSKVHPELIPLFPFKLAVYAEGNDTILSVLNPAELAPMLHADKDLQTRLLAWEKDFRAVLSEMRGATSVVEND